MFVFVLRFVKLGFTVLKCSFLVSVKNSDHVFVFVLRFVKLWFTVLKGSFLVSV